MDTVVMKSLEDLAESGKLNTDLVIWGVSDQEKEIIK